MLTTTPNLADPFAMLISPEQVMNAIGRSDRLARLHSRIYRPLDRPWIPVKGTAEFDSEIDAEVETDLSDAAE